jgi:SAM-dependent methyltransferase
MENKVDIFLLYFIGLITIIRLYGMQRMIIDLGCGLNKVAGAIGVDNVSLPGVDIQHDLLNFPYPFIDSACSEVYLNHVLEHFYFPDEQRILQEVARILTPNGILHIRVPHVYSIAAFADPTHRQGFTFGTGNFFENDSAKSYYKELEATWKLLKTSSRVTALNWKRYRLRPIDSFISNIVALCIDKLVNLETWPGAADLFVRAVPLFFVEIRWDLKRNV